ncbi:hypothetical protein [Flavobacterium sp. CGRL2]
MKKILVLITCCAYILLSCKKEKDVDDQKMAVADQKDSTDIADNGWPREITNNGTKLVYYQPQVDSWDDHKEIKARLAFSLTPKDGKQVLGVASLQASTLVDKDSRSVFFKDIKVTDVRFPALDEKKIPEMEKLFKETLPKGGDPVSVDRILADLDKTTSPAKGIAAQNSPPPIFLQFKSGNIANCSGRTCFGSCRKIRYTICGKYKLGFIF